MYILKHPKSANYPLHGNSPAPVLLDTFSPRETFRILLSISSGIRPRA